MNDLDKQIFWGCMARLMRGAALSLFIIAVLHQELLSSFFASLLAVSCLVAHWYICRSLLKRDV